METAYAIATVDSTLPASILMLIKKLTGESLGDIKNKVADSLPVFTCDCTDDDGLVLIARLHNSLAAEGFATRIFWHGMEEPYENLCNTIEMHRQIAEDDYPD